MNLEEICSSLPDDLAGDDVLVDCSSTAPDVIDIVILVEKVLARRHARSLTLLRPASEVANAATEVATSLGCLDRLRIQE